MKSTSLIKKIGLLLFIAGFGFFNAIFFMSDFRLTEDILRKNITDESTYGSMSAAASGMIGKTYAYNIPFLKDLDRAMEKANQDIIKIYGISGEEIDQMAGPYEGKENIIFSVENAQAALKGEEDVVSFRQKIFGDYTSWMDGQTFESTTALKNQLANTVKYMNNDVIRQKGIDEYEIKDLKTSLTKEATIGWVESKPGLVLLLTYIVVIAGALMYILPKMEELPGIKNNGIFFSKMKNRGWLGILTGTYLIAFYVFLYFYPHYMTNWIRMVDPISQWLKGQDAGRFFLYGFLYTLCILVMGVRMLIHYRHSNYHIVRTFSVMFFQLAFAFLIPEILLRLNKPYMDFKNIWPLDYDFFFPSSLNELLSSGGLGVFMLVWGIALALIAVPVLVYFFGKRWYCSWVCGCGGLAETLGDPYRQLSDKSLKAWRIERWMVHGVLVFAVLMTAGMIYTFFTGSGSLLGINTYTVSEVYGFIIGAGFAGVVGTGFYPFMGNRVWCRFGCPLAAYLGLVQRFKSRFRITTNGGQCISCGNCSTYCEMGIDVRWYAQRGQNIIRSSCVGCGICASVCPRGVLKLENKQEKGRFNEPILIGNDSVSVSH